MLARWRRREAEREQTFRRTVGFKRLGRNGDSKLMVDEVPGERLFKMLDKSGNGVVMMKEAGAFGGGPLRQDTNEK